ncbi:MAG: hypothetical protein IAE99_06650 [Rhodothermales bacterium]|nr:hypothetical protein [Rhodothermales bacterium]
MPRYEPLPAPRAKVSDHGWTIDVEIPARRSWFAVAFLSVWLVGWAFGWVAAFASVLGLLDTKPGDGFVLFWLVGWTVGGVFALYSWQWLVFGREVLHVSREGLTVQRKALFPGRTKRYAAASMRNLRVVSADPWYGQMSSLQMPWQNTGTLAFDYGAGTVRFATGLDEGEADLLRPTLAAKLGLPTDSLA